jgi:hypothetical protein
MPKLKSTAQPAEYVSNNSFMTSRVKVPNPFGNDYEDPLETLKAEQLKDKSLDFESVPTTPTTPTTPSPTIRDNANADSIFIQLATPTIPSPTIPTAPSHKLEPVSPNKDFQKVSNSITRQAIPSGIFGSGKAKQLYDALYSLTRGAIRPIRIIRITKPRLMKLAGIGTRQTLWLNLQHLESVGLVRRNVLLGEHGGNEYEVFIPEELPEINLKTIPTIPTIPTSPSNRVYQVQNLEGVVGIDSAPTAPSSSPINTGVSEAPKTSFKDNTKNDDDNARVSETFSVLAERLDDAVKKITGKGVSKSEAEKWGTLADLLILELEVAASRADGVSSIPAFLTEVLRRQFFAARREQEASSAKTSKAKIDTVGKPDQTGEYEIKPLDEKGREAALEQLKEFAGDEFLEDFKKWYTPQDWMWLMTQLEKQQKQ